MESARPDGSAPDGKCSCVGDAVFPKCGADKPGPHLLYYCRNSTTEGHETRRSIFHAICSVLCGSLHPRPSPATHQVARRWSRTAPSFASTDPHRAGKTIFLRYGPDHETAWRMGQNLTSYHFHPMFLNTEFILQGLTYPLCTSRC